MTSRKTLTLEPITIDALQDSQPPLSPLPTPKSGKSKSHIPLSPTKRRSGGLTPVSPTNGRYALESPLSPTRRRSFHQGNITPTTPGGDSIDSALGFEGPTEEAFNRWINSSRGKRTLHHNSRASSFASVNSSVKELHAVDLNALTELGAIAPPKNGLGSRKSSELFETTSNNRGEGNDVKEYPPQGHSLQRSINSPANDVDDDDDAKVSFPSSYFADRLIAIQAARDDHYEFLVSQTRTIKEAFPDYKAIARQWENAQAKIENIHGGICIFVVLPYMKQVRVRLCPALTTIAKLRRASSELFKKSVQKIRFRARPSDWWKKSLALESSSRPAVEQVPRNTSQQAILQQLYERQQQKQQQQGRQEDRRDNNVNSAVMNLNDDDDGQATQEASSYSAVKPKDVVGIKVKVDAYRAVHTKDSLATVDNTQYFGDFTIDGQDLNFREDCLSHRYNKQTGLLIIYLDQVQLDGDDAIQRAPTFAASSSSSYYGKVSSRSSSMRKMTSPSMSSPVSRGSSLRGMSAASPAGEDPTGGNSSSSPVILTPIVSRQINT